MPKPQMSDDPDLMDHEDCRPLPETSPPILEELPDYIKEGIARREAQKAGKKAA